MMKMVIGIVTQTIDALLAGFGAVFSTSARWAFFIWGLALYLLMLAQYHVYTFQSAHFGHTSHFLYIHIGSNLILSFLRFVIVLEMIRLLLIVFKGGGNLIPFLPTKETFLFFWNKDIIIKSLKGFLLSLLVIILPSLLIGFMHMRWGITLESRPVLSKIILDMSFAFSLTFLGFAFWILMDKESSLRKCISYSVRYGWHNVASLIVFYLATVALMVIFDMIPYAEVFAYMFYFPVALAAQGYLYQQLCAPHVSAAEAKVSFWRRYIFFFIGK
jgi:hypothetical protein